MNKIASAMLITIVTVTTALAESEHDATAQWVEDRGFRASEMPMRDVDGWQRPKKVAILTFDRMPDEGPLSAGWFTEVADGVDVQFIDMSGDDPDLSEVADADALMGWCMPNAIRAANNLKYLHIYSAGMERCLSLPELHEPGLTITNSAKAASETIGEHTIAMLLMLTRNLDNYHAAQQGGSWVRRPDGARQMVSLKGRTMLVLGLGGIGTAIAERAHALGMRVIGTRNSSRRGPDFVEYVGLADEMLDLAARADVVANALPMTDGTRDIVNAEFFAAMPQGGYYLTVGRGGTTVTEDLIAALESGHLQGAGLDVTDPEPLPDGHALWSAPNVIITPHTSASSDLSMLSTARLARENMRRYIAGEPMLNVVDPQRGY